MRNLFRRRSSEPKTEEQQQIDQAVVKTREASFGRIANLFREAIVTEETWEELEDLLIQADVGPATGMEPTKPRKTPIATRP